MNNQALLIMASALAAPLTASAQDTFLSDPSLLQSDPRFGADLVYLPGNVEERMRNYDSVMVDEPEVFIAPDSPYGGFKASDMAALTSMVRAAYIQGFTDESTNLQVVDEASPSTLYLRLALKNVYVKKNKRGLFTYTPVGAVMKGRNVIKPLSDTRIEEGDVIALFAMSSDVPEVERLLQVSIDFF